MDGLSFDGFSFDGFGTNKTKQERFSAWDGDENDADIHPGLKNIGVLFPKFNRKGDYRWLSIRTWDANEPEQIKWFKRIKIEQSPDDIDAIAEEFAQTIRQFVWKTDNCFVCNAPQGHSKTEKHFITEVGKVVAEKLGCEYVKMFGDRHLKGGTYADLKQDRGQITVIGHSAKPVCIFLDDICTSGMTMINCIRALRDDYTLIPICWIYKRRKS